MPTDVANNKPSTKQQHLSTFRLRMTWLLLGAVLGVAITLALPTLLINSDSNLVSTTPASSLVEHDNRQSNTDQPKAEFTFYDDLKNRVVTVRTDDIEEEKTEESVYYLQAASFKKPTDAEQLKAQLALNNLSVSIQTWNDGNQAWHRVMIGPFTNRSALSKAQNILVEQGLSRPVVWEK
jgi:cell division protein FtsN